VVRTDELRKELWGIGDELRLPQGAYSKEFSSRVYAVLAERTSLILKSGQSVIADGVFGTRPERDAVRQLAEALGISFSGLWLEGPQPILEKRIEGRIEDVSDATVAVLHSQMRDVEVPHDWKQIFVAGPAREILSKAKRALD
jgi:predicted kinase